MNAVILAGGSASRFGTAKHLYRIAGFPTLVWASLPFLRRSDVDKIVITLPSYLFEDSVRLFEEFVTDPRISFVVGGETRLESTQIGIRDFNESDFVVVHDAARPLVSDEIVAEVIEQLKVFESVDVGIPNTDTIFEIDKSSGTVKNFLERSEIFRGQTPQGFRVGLLTSAWRAIQTEENFTSVIPTITCDCSLIRLVFPDVAIKVILGHESNLKLTYPFDVVIANSYFSSTRPRTNLEPYSTNSKLASAAGKNVLILGGTSGIGLAVLELAKKLKIKAMAASRTTGLDLTNITEIDQFMNRLAAERESFNEIVISVGSLSKNLFTNLNISEIDSEISSNFQSVVYFLSRWFFYFPDFRGGIHIISSSSYSTARREMVLYSSMKAALVALGQGLADELAPKVRVNVVCPQRTNTPLRAKAFGEEDQTTLLTPMEVAQKIIEIMLSDSSGLIKEIQVSNRAHSDL